MTTMLGEMLVKYSADISDMTSKVKQVKSDMASVDDTAQKTGAGIFSGFKKGVSSVLEFGSKLGQTVFGVKYLAQAAIG